MNNEIDVLTERLTPALRQVGLLVFERNRLKNGIADDLKFLKPFVKYHGLKSVRDIKSLIFYRPEPLDDKDVQVLSEVYARVEIVLDQTDGMDGLIQDILKRINNDKVRFVSLLEQQGLESTDQIEIKRPGKGCYLQLKGSR